ncbi:MAG: hypothetical protein BJ554DRAFT_2330 [Olpidium bornovanus]|uniref:SCP domain-containing protein n=1 Tax=Olpidium bornovanus TaxID=278681 RepID=A0A8H8DGH5_9FUNG|nr:MAG: hypothetical protein BJ554DRAFT_2330 [Olpidium bornovanus]
MVNRERMNRGIRPLVLSPALVQSTLRHSRLQAKANKLSHSSFRGEAGGLGGRINAVGLRPIQMAENIAAGQQTAQEVMETWMASPGTELAARHAAARFLFSAELRIPQPPPPSFSPLFPHRPPQEHPQPQLHPLRGSRCQKLPQEGILDPELRAVPDASSERQPVPRAVILLSLRNSPPPR